MTLDNSLNHDILHSLCFHSLFRHYNLDGEGTDEDGRIMLFSYSTPREIARGLKRIWNFQMGETLSSARIIEDAERALEAL